MATKTDSYFKILTACTNSQATLSRCSCSNSCSICPNSSHSFALELSGRLPVGPELGERGFLASLLFFSDFLDIIGLLRKVENLDQTRACTYKYHAQLTTKKRFCNTIRRSSLSTKLVSESRSQNTNFLAAGVWERDQFVLLQPSRASWDNPLLNLSVDSVELNEAASTGTGTRRQPPASVWTVRKIWLQHWKVSK